jgi:hypothetical protein
MLFHLFEKKVFCIQCHHVGYKKKQYKGSLAVEILAWLLMILPGLLYTLWRSGTAYDACAGCGATEIIPVNSVRAVNMMNELKRVA